MPNTGYVLSVTPATNILSSRPFVRSTCNAYVRTKTIKRGTYEGSPATLVLFDIDLGKEPRTSFAYVITVEKVTATGVPAQEAPPSMTPSGLMSSGTAIPQTPNSTQSLAHGASDLLSKVTKTGNTLLRTAVLPGWRKTEEWVGWRRKGQLALIAAAGPWEITSPTRPVQNVVTHKAACEPAVGGQLSGYGFAVSGPSRSEEASYSHDTTPGARMYMDWSVDTRELIVKMLGSPDRKIAAPRTSTIGLVIPHSGAVEINVKYAGVSGSLFETAKTHHSPQTLTGTETAGGNPVGPAHMTSAVWQSLLVTPDVSGYDGESGHLAWVMQLDGPDEDDTTAA